MKTSKRDHQILQLIASMPFLDRLDIAALSNLSRGTAYHATERLERRNLVESIPHATNLIPPTRRFALTHHGIFQLARINHSHIDRILQAYPVSEHRRRTLLHRLDAAAVIYRLAATAATTAYPPIHLQWFRASPIDAAFTFANHRSHQTRTHIRPNPLRKAHPQTSQRTQSLRRLHPHHRPTQTATHPQTPR